MPKQAMPVIKLSCVLILVCSLISGSASSLWAATQEEERVAKLVEGARKEGKFVWYSQMSLTEAVPMLRKFEERYPFIKGELLRLGLNQLLPKVLEEHRAGVNKFDVVYLSGFGLRVLKKTDVLQRYVSPQSLFFPQGTRDPDGYGTSGHMIPKVIVYNTRLVAPKDAPKSYEDLLNPMWKKNKLAMDTTNYEWYANVLKIMGREKAIELMKGLSKQQPQIRTGNTLRTTLVSAGEYLAGVPVNMDRVEAMKAVGAPIEWVGAEPVVTLTHMVALAAKSAHPNAAKLFIDFLLSREGQETLRSVGIMPARPDVLPPRLTKGLKLSYSDTSLAETGYDEIVREYDDIFRRRTWKGEKW